MTEKSPKSPNPLGNDESYPNNMLESRIEPLRGVESSTSFARAALLNASG